MGKINIVLSPSQQRHNSCKYGDTEFNHMTTIGKLVETALKKDSRLNVYRIPELNETLQTNSKYLYEIARLSNAFITKNGGKGYHIALHSDAFDGKARGSSTFFAAAGGNGEKMAKAIHSEVVKISGKSRGCFARPELLEVGSKIIASSALTEIDFHDNVDGAKKIHANLKQFSEAIINGIYNGISLKRPVEPVIKFIVQAGAFTTIEAAESLQNELIKKGFNAIIKNV